MIVTATNYIVKSRASRTQARRSYLGVLPQGTNEN